MGLFRRRPPPRIPHVEPGFSENNYARAYSEQTGSYSGADFRRITNNVLNRIRVLEYPRVLDVGAGPGWIGIRLAQLHSGVHVTGIDLSDAFLDVARLNTVAQRVEQRVVFRRGDAATMTDFRDDSFDVIVSNQSLHYWEPPEGVFNQMSRVLKPQGIFCIGDDRRDLTWFGKLDVMFGTCFHSRRIGRSWKQSVAGCFTPEEIKRMLERSRLRGQWDMQVHSRTILITGKCHG